MCSFHVKYNNTNPFAELIPCSEKTRTLMYCVRGTCAQMYRYAVSTVARLCVLPKRILLGFQRTF